jgi:LuxR family transcriptional regulator, maltose regulon positive regulatory protein
MPKKAKAQVRGNILTIRSESSHSPIHIRVESKEWFAWLDKNTGFAFRDNTGFFTARREQIKGRGQYWYAYRRHGKKMRKKYLGKTPKLTLVRMKQIATLLGNTTDTIQTEIMPIPKEVTPAGAIWSDGSLLISTKFTPPPLPNDMVFRSRLTNQITTPILGVTAPAGFGKTTVVTEWLLQQQVTYAWVSLDETDNDPLTFWRYVLTTLEPLYPTIRFPTASLSAQNIREILIKLINAFQDIETHLWLVLDDFHSITNEDIHVDLLFLIEHRSPGLNFIFASRTRLPFALSNLRMKNQYSELIAVDLRFTISEGLAYFQQKSNISLTETEKVLLIERTEGWVAGLHLAALALRREKDIERVLQQLDGSSPFLEEYYLDSVLSKEPGPIQEFLLQTSVLRYLTSDLCNVVTNRMNSAENLAYLERENLFISPLSDRQGWYRYHPMFANVLSTELEKRSPELLPELHQKAATWYQENRFSDDAVRHLILASDWKVAADLIQELAPTLLLRGEVYRLQQWLEKIPKPILQTHTQLYLIYARVNGKSLSEVVQWLEKIPSDRIRSADESQEIYADSDRLITFLSAAERDLSLDKMPAAETYQVLWQEIDLMLLSLSHWMKGEWQGAGESLEQAMALSFTNNHQYIALQTVGMLVMQHMNQGRLRQSEKIIQQVRTHFQLNLSQLPTLLILALCYIRFEKNQLDVAYALLQEGLAKDDVHQQGEIYIRSQFFMARILSALGQKNESEKVLQSIIAETGYQNSHWLPNIELKAYQAHLWILHDKLDLADQWLYETGMSVDDVLTQENSYAQLIHAQILIRKKKYTLVDRLLKRMQAAFPAGLRTEPYLRLLLPHALVLFKLGNLNQAIRVLRKVLQMTQPEGYIRPYLAYGVDIHTLLYLVKQQGQTSKPIQEHIQRLLRELEQMHGSIMKLGKDEFSSLLLAATISQREREILDLIAAGHSNQTIADNLLISLNTVKSHLRRIYQKLEVSNRTQAVTKGREINLL